LQPICDSSSPPLLFDPSFHLGLCQLCPDLGFISQLCMKKLASKVISACYSYFHLCQHEYPRYSQEIMDMRIGSCEPVVVMLFFQPWININTLIPWRFAGEDQRCEHLLICLGVNSAFQFVPTIDELVVARGNQLCERALHMCCCATSSCQKQPKLQVSLQAVNNAFNWDNI
jgi:hypothetical protein